MLENHKVIDIVNTRPGKRGEYLTEMLQQQGYRVLTFPIQKMVSVAIDAIVLEELSSRESDWIFISPMAVESFVSQVAINDMELSYTPKLFAVGRGTADCLKKHFPKLDVFYPNDSHGAQALINLIAKKNMLSPFYYIFRAETGSELLAETFTKQKIDFQEVICYERQLTDEIKNKDLNQVFDQNFPQIVILTSFEAFKFLHYYYTSALWLKHALITVTSNQMLQWAKKMSYDKLLLLESLDNKAILDTIVLNSKPSV
ncbi:uroporphyrinogen-III synthase [Thiotrichales bacterium 19S3-7]|nr:uroporphyrinogen-III synthase [Thiotrichales bacterium 19S3-7]MCF6802524.1 uroporphyrinogen-III synthase [Thiotrichales bacterium 19S3-11]